MLTHASFIHSRLGASSWACLIAILTMSSASWAQGSAAVTVDRNPVVAGSPFRITFEFKDASVDFQRPPAIEGVRFINGPSTSTSTQIVNGAMSSTRSYTYTAVASTPGLIQIPSLSFPAKGGTLATRPIALRVAKASSRPSKTRAQFSAAIEVDKRQVHLGEPIRVQYRIYNRVDGVDVRSYTFPDLSGVWRETVDGEDPRWENTVIDGQRFQVATVRTDILYPTRTGELVLEGFDVDAQARISFFNTRPMAASAPVVTVNVAPLPGEAPAPSLGTFSNLKLKWRAEGTNPRKANEAVNVVVEFSGEGNLGLLGAPDIQWPADLEVFDPDIQDRIRTTVDGQRGKRTFTYLVIPRAEGEYEVALPAMSYFDHALDRHRTLSAASISLQVEGNAQEDSPSFGFNSKSDVTILTRDVRFIRTETELRPLTQRFFGGPLHLLLWAFPPLTLAAFACGRRRHQQGERDPRKARQKAASAALKRALAGAHKGEVDVDELGRSVHGFLQAELGLSQSSAGRDAYAAALAQQGMSNVRNAWLDIVDAVNRGRFAPGAPSPGDLADRIESAMAATKPSKNSGRSGKMATLLLLMGWTAWTAQAAPDPAAAMARFQAGNVAYTEGDFASAIAAYEEVASEWTSFELEYNLGGAHYKAGLIGPCILHYERARQLRPNDDDLNANLLLAQASVTDRIEALPDIGMATLWKELISQERLAGWTAGSLILWFLGFLLLAARLMSRELSQRRALGLLASALLCLALAAGALSKQTHQRIISEHGAVIMVPRVEVKAAPSSAGDSPDLFILHEGTVVEILRDQDGWTMVRLANGNTGWLDTASLQAI